MNSKTDTFDEIRSNVKNEVNDIKYKCYRTLNVQE